MKAAPERPEKVASSSREGGANRRARRTPRSRLPLTILAASGLLLLTLIFAASPWDGIGRGDGENGQAEGSDHEQALALYAQGDFAAAQERLAEAGPAGTASAEQSLLLGRTLEAQGRIAEAQEAYEASLAADPAQPEALHNLALVLLAQGQVQPAVERLERAVELGEEFVGARLLLADTYRAQGEVQKARAQYEYVIELEPVGVDVAALEEGLSGLD